MRLYKILGICLVAVLCVASLCFAGCKTTKPELPTPTPESSTEAAIQSSKFALVFGSSDSMGAYAQAGLKGVEEFATTHNGTFAPYAPGDDSPESLAATIETSIAEGANIVVCLGPTSPNVVYAAQIAHPDTIFLVIDSQPTDETGAVNISQNTHCIMFRSEQVGYLAGYALVKEGFRDIAFCGGMNIPSVNQFGYGYLQGIAAAATELGVTSDIYVTYWYADTFSASDAVATEVAHWLETGTQVVFSCGGATISSVIAATAGHDAARIVGVDADQADLSPLIITSATKQIESVIIDELTTLMENKGTWKKNQAGKTAMLGVAENAVALTTDSKSWRFANYTIGEYNTLYESIKNGTVSISSDTTTRPEVPIQVRWKNEAL